MPLCWKYEGFSQGLEAHGSVACKSLSRICTRKAQKPTLKARKSVGVGWSLCARRLKVCIESQMMSKWKPRTEVLLKEGNSQSSYER